MIYINVMTRKLRMCLSGRRYNERHPDRVRESCRKWYAANPDNARKRYEENINKCREQHRNWKAANPAKCRENARKWLLKNSDKHRETTRKWGKVNPDRRRAAWHRRRARKLDNGGSWTATEWQTLTRQYGYRCVGCWKHEAELRLLGRKLVPDHIIPISKGGLNHICNLQPLCHGKGSCNLHKGSKYQDFVVS